VSELIYDPAYKKLGLSKSLGTKEWGRRTLTAITSMLDPNHPSEYDDWHDFKWLDQMSLFTWAISKLSETDNLPFVLNYWDFHPKNAIVNDRLELR